MLLLDEGLHATQALAVVFEARGREAVYVGQLSLEHVESGQDALLDCNGGDKDDELREGVLAVEFVESLEVDESLAGASLHLDAEVQGFVERSRFFVDAVAFEDCEDVLADLLRGDGEGVASHTFVARRIERVARLPLKQAHDGIDSLALIGKFLKFQFHTGMS